MMGRRQFGFAGFAMVSGLMLSACVPVQQYNALQAKYQQLQQQMNTEIAADQAQITLLQGELKVTMKDQILFPEGGWEINSKAEATLRKLVPALQGLMQTQVVVDGYTDNVPVGRELQRRGIANNLDLSSRRADVVASYLVKQGVPANLVSAQGFGDTRPVAPNDTAAGRAQNRRIEVTLRGPGT